MLVISGCEREEPNGDVPEYVRELEQQGHRVARPPDLSRHRDVQDDVRHRMMPWLDDVMTTPRSLYVPMRDSLLGDVGTLHRVLHDCASREKCHMAITSEDQDYLIEQLHELCRVQYFGSLPSADRMHLYLYVDATRHAAAREAILPCRQRFVIVERGSKRTLAVLEPAND